MLWDWMTSRSRRAAPVVFLAMSLLGVSACRSPEVLPPPVTDQALGWLHTDGARLRSDDQKSQRIRAVSWFGLETQTCAPHGLSTLTVDGALATMASMGFNAIRLPYSSACLARSTTTGIDPTLNPDLVGATPLQVMDLIVEGAAQHHLSIILDRHRLNSDGQSELWYDGTYPEKTWIADWTMLAQRYVDNPTVIGADLQNEPHGAACWACDDPARDWRAAATRAGNAILAVNPHWLILVEGVDHQTTGESTWWGGGLADVRQSPVVLEQPDRLVYSPHTYPPSIFDQQSFHESDYPDNLPASWDRTWGYLQRDNLAPVLLGEFGSKLKTEADREWMTTMVGYLNADQTSFGYWAFNPDSSDTGGLVEKDWTTPEKAKLAALEPLFVPVTDPGPTGSPASPLRTENAFPSPTDPISPTPEPSRSSPDTTSAAPSSPSQPRTAQPSPEGPVTPTGVPTLAASWQPQSSWGEGYAVNIKLTASGAAVKGWTLTWPDSKATAIQNSWGTSCSIRGATVVCQAKDWGVYVPAGGSVTVGVQVTSTAGSPSNPQVTVTPAG